MSAHHSLPLLTRREDELTKCAFCPKLCRATCVVSEQEPREALTPWGKMTNAYDAARSGELDPDRADLAWACSNCFRCREACDHRNPVTQTLNEARAEYVQRGLAPTRVAELLARETKVNAEHAAAAALFQAEPGVRSDAAHALLLGCRYSKVFPVESRAAIRLAVELVGAVRLIEGCCGAWQLAAGAPTSAFSAQERLRAELGNAKRLLVLDPRCALSLASFQPMTLLELAASHAERFRLAQPQAVRYHDTCALGRGLGLYEQPRQLLARVTGAAPQELEWQRELARCSGAGGLLPVSMPEVSRAAGDRLASEHVRLGGGTLVTSCAASLSRLRGSGVDAVDLMTLLSAGLRTDG